MRPRFPSAPRRRPVRLRPGLLLRRDPRAWWLAVSLCAVLTGATVSHAIERAERARAGWGAMRSVLVAERDLRPGDTLDPDDVQLVERPRTMVPASALRTIPRSATVGQTILAGEIVVSERLADRALSDVAARIPDGQRAVAIPVDAALTPPLSVGDRVDLLVALGAAPPSGPTGFVVAAGALVIAVEEAAVTVAVTRDIAPKVAIALGQGAVTLALVGG